MAARDAWDFELKCPKCGAVGRSYVSEEDHPSVSGNAGFRVDEVEGEFRVKTVGGSSPSTVYECTVCKAEVAH